MHLFHRQPCRPATRTTLRRPFRHSLRGCLRGRGGPSDFTQMLTACGKAIRAHRQLARLAPSFFDAAVVNRERENRVEKQKWMAMWEPIIAKAYGVPPKPPDLTADLPRLPSPNTQRAVERRLAEVQLWLEAGAIARQRHQQRRPHALPTLSQLARLLQQAFDLKKLVLGLDSKTPLPDKITYDYEFTDLKRAYGHQMEESPPASSSAQLKAGGVAAGGAVPDGLCSHPASRSLVAVEPPALETLAGPVVSVTPHPAPPPPRCDTWSRWARRCRDQQKGGVARQCGN
jgi:hypothetical protein